MLGDTVDGSGPIALLGSGEYLAVMDETDAGLVQAVGGKELAHVALMATACALEEGEPERWNQLGLGHFLPLAGRASAIPLLRRDDAEAEGVLDLLRQANIFYFSGGNPQYLIDTMANTAAWQVIQSRLREGAAIAGCSAGAIMLGSYRVNLRAILAGDPPSWGEAMGIVPRLAVLPHFDRGRRRLGDEAMAEVLTTILELGPADAVLAGIEEDTALVRTANEGGRWWQVKGRQNVVLYTRGARPHVLSPGDTLRL